MMILKFKKKNVYDNLNVEENTTSISNKKQNTSCPSFLKIFPNILDNMTAFLKHQVYATRFRRRTKTDYTSGAQIPWHLFQTVSGLQLCGISLSTINSFSVWQMLVITWAEGKNLISMHSVIQNLIPMKMKICIAFFQVISIAKSLLLCFIPLSAYYWPVIWLQLKWINQPCQEVTISFSNIF